MSSRPPLSARRPSVPSGPRARPRHAPPEPLPGKSRDLLASVQFALDGIVYAVRHERNVKIHFVSAVGVLVACLVLPLEPFGVLLALGATCLVLVAELVNTAIESVVNMTIRGHHPLARIAKDVAAAAVLVAAFYSLAVAWQVLLPGVHAALSGSREPLWQRIAQNPGPWGCLAATLGILAGVVLRAVFHQGPFPPGKLILGHAALGFGVSAAVLAVTREPATALLALPFGALVARPRIRGGLHRWPPVLGGAALGATLSLSLFLSAREVVP